MVNFLIAAFAGLITGIISGFGIGGGTVLMVYLTVLAGISQRTAQGINLLYFIPTAIAALFIHAKNRFIDWKVVLPAAVVGCISAGILSYVAMSMELSLLKRLFGLFLIATGLSELLKKSS